MGLRGIEVGFCVRYEGLPAEQLDVRLATPREVDSTGDTDPSELVYEVSPVRLDVAGPVVGIRVGRARPVACI